MLFQRSSASFSFLSLSASSPLAIVGVDDARRFCRYGSERPADTAASSGVRRYSTRFRVWHQVDHEKLAAGQQRIASGRTITKRQKFISCFLDLLVSQIFHTVRAPAALQRLRLNRIQLRGGGTAAAAGCTAYVHLVRLQASMPG